MRAAFAFVFAFVLSSAAAYPLPRSAASSTTRERQSVDHVYKHRHFDAAHLAAQRAHAFDSQIPARHRAHGKGYWTDKGTWRNENSGGWSSSAAIPQPTQSEAVGGHGDRLWLQRQAPEVDVRVGWSEYGLDWNPTRAAASWSWTSA